MIGVSLPLEWLLRGHGLPGDPRMILQVLKDRDVDSIELRTVRPWHSAAKIRECAELLWEQGFQVTVHGTAVSAETAVTDVYGPLAEIWKGLAQTGQKELVITIHPIDGDNVRMLTALSDYAAENSYPVCIALENNRLLPDKTEGDSARLVCEAVRKVNRENVGICFDMGHYLYYLKKNCPERGLVLPDKEFLSLVRHTHIHALKGEKTHYPPSGYEFPFRELLSSFAFGYFGVYNLELTLEPGAKEACSADDLLQSVDKLRENLPICAKVYQQIRKYFDSSFRTGVKVLEGGISAKEPVGITTNAKREAEGTRMSLVRSSSFLFCTDGFGWGLDLSFRNCRKLAETPCQVAELLRNLKLMIITHGHEDHFEEETVKALADSETCWVIPDFLTSMALRFGLRKEKIITARIGEALKIGPLTILPFVGMHFRKETGVGVKQYGYYVVTDGGISLTIPGDVRDFSPEGLPQIPESDYCIANVWLGDQNGLIDDPAPYTEIFAQYMLRFSKKNILLAHLYEDGREDDVMWRKEHGEAVGRAVGKLSPATGVSIPFPGEIYTL